MAINTMSGLECMKGPNGFGQRRLDHEIQDKAARYICHHYCSAAGADGSGILRHRAVSGKRSEGFSRGAAGLCHYDRKHGGSGGCHQ